ncbi:MAG: 16S rRNA (cytosine(1402)-N(4))-methyltransferase [Gammaproteobacteria bacterium TMED78]|mgnify:CR=1 FL=1|nr:MAG: 16S rRNA (cytosine(1402)-N(4))-methyltransferase [Gammaproteobacteria bacterium TMED78]|tara:strand:- start:84122 stop:85072 length:951 start_codon:yes stop_codon:yes gene_type:complete
MIENFNHQPVLIKEVIESLAIIKSGNYIDATYGRGGHSEYILKHLGVKGKLLAIDKDLEAFSHAEKKHFADPRFIFCRGGFEDLAIVASSNLEEGEKVNGILVDLGVSSPQLDNPERGFSFSKNGPLDMRMNQEIGETAADWLRETKESELISVFYKFGEEPRSKQIARAIIREREKKDITETIHLSQIVEKASGYKKSKTHPATRIFQAIRIKVNSELEYLEKMLNQSIGLLENKGRLCVISFHSLEDRIVKRFISKMSKEDPVYSGLPEMPPAARPKLTKVSNLIIPKKEEVLVNPRSRSAKLRVCERLSFNEV